MSEQLTVEKDEATGTIAAHGRVNTATASTLEEALSGAGTQVTLDLADVEYLSSAGLRVIVAAFKQAKRTGGGLAIVNCQPDVLEVFEITGLADVLQVS